MIEIVKKEPTEQQENCKIVAEFMGILVLKGYNEHTNHYYYYWNNPIFQDFEAIPDYENNWNDLMPVYIKIAKWFSEDEFEFSNEETILFNIMYERLGDGDGIEEVFKHTLDFIRLFNNRNKIHA